MSKVSAFPIKRGSRRGPVWKSKFYAAFVLNRRVVLHAIDATPARRRGDAASSPLDRAGTAASSPRNDLEPRVHRLPGKFFFLRPPADPPGPLRVLPRRGAQRQKEAREGPHRFQWKFHKVCETCDGVGRSVGELKVRAVRIVNFFCCDGPSLSCINAKWLRSSSERNPPADKSHTILEQAQ